MFDRTDFSDRELEDATHPRDAQTVGHFEVRFTDPDAWLKSLDLDLAAGDIVGGVVWVALTRGLATVNDVKGRRILGGNREVEYFRSSYVEASYLDGRGQIQKLSHYCGVVCVEESQNPAIQGNQRQMSVKTAGELQSVVRKLETALSKHKDLQVRYGGAMHLHSTAEPWVSHPDMPIETPERVLCATCGEAIHFSNNAWRHDKDNRPEAYRRRASGRVFDHMADPEEKGKQA